MHPQPTLHDVRRRWLAAALRGEQPPWVTELGDIEDMLAATGEEGVAALVDSALRSATGKSNLPKAFVAGLTTAARVEVAITLLREAECRRILECLGAKCLPVLLLKGSSLAYWAYDSAHLRSCADIDLLVTSPEAAEAAAAALQGLGQERIARVVPGDSTTYELTCVRLVGRVRLEADLHWGIGGAPIFADRIAIAELFDDSIPLPRLAPEARAIGPVHAYAHACMHRALQLHLGTGDRLKWLYDLHLLAEHVTVSDWDRLATLCEQRGLAGTCLHAMHASAALFATRIPAAIAERLTTARRTEKLDIERMYDWGYVQRMNFLALPSARQRLIWLKQRLLPSRAYRQDMYGGGRWTSLGRYLHSGLRKLFN
jgi:Uncharacterised nucleotidyltransferase